VRYLAGVSVLAVGLALAAGYCLDIAPLGNSASRGTASSPEVVASGSAEAVARSEAKAEVPALVRSRTSAVAPPRPVGGPVAGLSAAAAPLFSSAAIPLDTSQGSGLVHAVLDELRRIGCYQGTAQDTWTPAAQSAMRRALALTNAQLPVDRVDTTMLALVRSLPREVCGCQDSGGSARKSCPALVPPKPELAHAPERRGMVVAEPAATGGTWTTIVAPAPVPAQHPVATGSLASNGLKPQPQPQLGEGSERPAPLPGRMTLSGPTEPQATAAVPPPVTGRSTPAAPREAESSRPPRQGAAAPSRPRMSASESLFRHPLGF
jgi:hypothetical protein